MRDNVSAILKPMQRTRCASCGTRLRLSEPELCAQCLAFAALRAVLAEHLPALRELRP